MLSAMKTCLTSLRPRCTALSSVCAQATNSQIPNLSTSCLQKLRLPSSIQAMNSVNSGFPCLIPVRGFHIFHQQEFPGLGGTSNLLAVAKPGYMPQVRTFKYKAILQKRCKDCYYASYAGQMMILCKTHPRHKQKKIMPYLRPTQILTHATQNRKRPW